MPKLEGPSPRISVIMANYNAEAYLPQALQSVLDQTFKDLELIFVDDGSTDSSVDIAQYYAAKDSRIRVFSGQRRGGPSPVRNFALDQARGDWIAVVDSDDHIHPERFERLLQFAVAKNVDILIDDLLIFDNEGIVDPQTSFHRHLGFKANAYRFNYVYSL